jgi:hypothetical protein
MSSNDADDTTDPSPRRAGGDPADGEREGGTHRLRGEALAGEIERVREDIMLVDRVARLVERDRTILDRLAR